MSNYVFLGGLYPKEMEQELYDLCGGRLSFAANKHQWNMIQGIEENVCVPITLINTFFIPPYPTCKRMFIKKQDWIHAEGAHDKNIGFLNARWLRNLWQQRGVYHALKAYLEEHEDENVTAFLYTMRFSVMKSVDRLKKKGFRFHTCLIVPDVPSVLAQYQSRQKLLQRISSYYNLKHVERFSAEMDSFVLLSEPMKQIVNVQNKPYCVVDGLCDREMMKNNLGISVDFSGKKLVVYTGSLHREYGICTLLDEFQKIKDPNFRLVIAGSGNAIKDVYAACKKDERISYVGMLRSSKVKELQSCATVLVNPRPADGVDAKYSFPSKTIEYMLAGKPVVMNRLEGMDSIYDQFMFTPKRCGCCGLGKTIEYVCSLSEEDIERVTVAARQFIIDEKNSKTQMKRVLDMVQP